MRCSEGFLLAAWSPGFLTCDPTFRLHCSGLQMALPCRDNDQAGDSGALTSGLWNQLNYTFYVIARLSSGEPRLALCSLPTCTPALASSRLPGGHAWGIRKRPGETETRMSHTTFLSLRSDLSCYLIKWTTPPRASYFRPEGWESLHLPPSILKYKDSGESSRYSPQEESKIKIQRLWEGFCYWIT